jgi:predicted component of type VI protein secretion system
VWDQHQTIELVIGPVSWYSLRALIPGGSKHKQLQAVIYRITDRCCDCRVTFIWPRNQVPKPKLGQGRKLGNGVLTLGYTATLAGRQRSEKSARKPLRVSFLIKTMEQDNDSP